MIASLVSIPIQVLVRTDQGVFHDLTIDCLRTQNRRVATQKTSAWEKIHCQPACITTGPRRKLPCKPLLFGAAWSADPMWAIFV